MGVVIQAIRDSARGESCTLRTAWCNHDPATTVFCHAPSHLKGLANKADDWWGAYGCCACHEALDQHLMADGAPLIWQRGIAVTQRRLYEKGIMQFPEKTKAVKTVSKIVPRPERFRR